MPDYTTPLGKTRLLSADLDEAAPLLSDEILSGYLALHADNPYRAAADALDAMATSATLLDRKIRSQDIQTDGPAVAAELRKKAADLRSQADTADLVLAGSYFEIIGDELCAEAAERPIW
jgi:hypothetical protein